MGISEAEIDVPVTGPVRCRNSTLEGLAAN